MGWNLLRFMLGFLVVTRKEKEDSVVSYTRMIQEAGPLAGQGGGVGGGLCWSHWYQIPACMLLIRTGPWGPRRSCGLSPSALKMVLKCTSTRGLHGHLWMFFVCLFVYMFLKGIKKWAPAEWGIEVPFLDLLGFIIQKTKLASLLPCGLWLKRSMKAGGMGRRLELELVSGGLGLVLGHGLSAPLQHAAWILARCPVLIAWLKMAISVDSFFLFYFILFLKYSLNIKNFS